MKAAFDIHEIIIRSFKGGLTSEEQAFLKAWKSESREHQLEYFDYEAIWKESGKLSFPMKLNLSRSLVQTRQKAGIEPLRINRRRFLLQAAAVLVLAVVFASAYVYFSRDENAVNSTSEAAWQEVKTPYGTQTVLKLSDGSDVFLNSGSTLKFPVSFDRNHPRMVQLDGEGFFSVTGNRDQPFVVNAGSLQICVTGTRFNVDAYPANREIIVALAEGEVNIQKESQKGVSGPVRMKPGDVATYNQIEKSFQIKNMGNLGKYCAWTEGKIVFSDDPIQYVAEKLGNWYNVEIGIADRKLETYRFTGTFFDEPVEQVLYLLSISSGMRYEIIPAKKLDDNTYSKRKIILKSKRI